MKERLITILTLLTLLMPGCSDRNAPQNLEPVLTLREASDVTRTEAVLSVDIESAGTGRLSYLHFLYSKDGEIFTATDDMADPSGTVSVRLTGLTPGTTYTYYAVGGTSTATLKTETLTFSTIPNELPTLSEVEMLSTGPTAVVVRFTITEDGGEPILEAGCEVSEEGTGESRRYYAPATDLKRGEIQFLLNSLRPLTGYVVTPFCSNSVGERRGERFAFRTEETVRLTEPGQLYNILGLNDYTSAHISVSGGMNGDDFHFLRRLLEAPDLPGEEPLEGRLETLDLSDVEIAEGGGSYDGSRYTQAGVISTGLFADCSNLRGVVLPFTATAIERDAFSGSRLLGSIDIPAGVERLLPSSGCTGLESITVSPANTHYRSIDGVLFNHDATEILWFPLGKSGEYTLPESISAIGENAFKDTKITSLIIPESVLTISRGAFAGSALREITLPDNLRNLSEGMFQNCTELRIVRTGRGTEFLGDYLFDGCPLEHLYITAEWPPFVSTAAFKGCEALYESCTLHVPAGMRAIYRNHAQFGKFRNITENQSSNGE